MRIFVKVKPRSSVEKAEKVGNSNFVVYTKKPPVRGEANDAVMKILADYFGVPKSRINIVSGKLSKNKIVEII